jgi:hypothetical protein
MGASGYAAIALRSETAVPSVSCGKGNGVGGHAEAGSRLSLGFAGCISCRFLHIEVRCIRPNRSSDLLTVGESAVAWYKSGKCALTMRVQLVLQRDIAIGCPDLAQFAAQK